MKASTAFLRQALSSMKVDLQFADLLLKVAKAPITITPEVTPADFIEADYPGYTARSVVPSGEVWDDSAGNACHSCSAGHYQPNAGTLPNEIHAWYLTGTIGGVVVVIAAAEIVPPVTLSTAADALDIVAIIKLGQPADLVGVIA